ncbi:hypothetical protein RUM43_014897 [Polyplax serrata]|uniref:Uncharacterized protein n=1 Tax=Polyplax serrata TaxID=468196 RepID=A0AAN8NI21_POLSC
MQSPFLLRVELKNSKNICDSLKRKASEVQVEEKHEEGVKEKKEGEDGKKETEIEKKCKSLFVALSRATP